MEGSGRNIFLFVIWARARKFEPAIRDRLAQDFDVLAEVEIQWPRWGFTRKLFEFYQFGSWFTWWNKARKCGRGPFKVIVIEDRQPIWKHRHDTRGQELIVDDRVYQVKREFRQLTRHSNIVHSSVTQAETEQQLQALFGCGTATFLDNCGDELGEYLGEGHRRICYRLKDGGACLKYYMTAEDMRNREARLAAKGKSPMRKTVLREIKRARFLKSANTCAQEFANWCQLREQVPAALAKVFPEEMRLRFDRRLGWCVQESAVLNADGTVPHSVLYTIRRTSDSDLRQRIIQAYCRLRDDLCACRVRFFDPPNVLLQWLPDGDFRLRIVDLEPAARTLIPVDQFFPSLVAVKTRRRFNRYLSRLKEV